MTIPQPTSQPGSQPRPQADQPEPREQPPAPPSVAAAVAAAAVQPDASASRPAVPTTTPTTTQPESDVVRRWIEAGYDANRAAVACTVLAENIFPGVLREGVAESLRAIVTAFEQPQDWRRAGLIERAATVLAQQVSTRLDLVEPAEFTRLSGRQQGRVDALLYMVRELQRRRVTAQEVYQAVQREDQGDPFGPEPTGWRAAPACAACKDTGRASGPWGSAHCACKRGRRASELWYADKHGLDHPDRPDPEPDFGAQGDG
jgi:hypothetical protein